MNRSAQFPYLKAGVVVAAALATTACGNSRAVRGYVFDTELADAIQPGVDNRTSVESTLGTPTMTAAFDESTWYYVSTTVRVRPVFWPDPQQHRVLIVAFNDRGVVSSVNNLGLEDMQGIDAVADKTPTRGRKQNFFQAIFGAIGRFGGAAPNQQRGNQGGNRPRGPNG